MLHHVIARQGCNLRGLLASQIPRKQTSLVLSYLTSLLAENATAMYGNIHSSYFGELAKRFAAANKPSHHLNPDCPETGICP